MWEWTKNEWPNEQQKNGRLERRKKQIEKKKAAASENYSLSLRSRNK